MAKRVVGWIVDPLSRVQIEMDLFSLPQLSGIIFGFQAEGYIRRLEPIVSSFLVRQN